MLETPAQFNSTAPLPYPADRLGRFRYHTGATLTPLDADEACPVLFRDIGPQAMARFLRGQLRRWAGPLSPIIYLRTCEYEEPYTDYAQIGRLVFLRPLALHPWHSGVSSIYIADARQLGPPEAVGFIPGHVSLAYAQQAVAEVRNTYELREVLGNAEYDATLSASLKQLDQLNAEHELTERLAEPLRIAFQSGDNQQRDRVLNLMQQFELTESDLCTAWHHLPSPRRAFICEALQQLPPHDF